MRILVPFLLAACAVVSVAQAPFKIPKAELAKGQFMLGKHRSTKLETFMSPDGKPTMGKSTSDCRLTMDGSYIEMNETMTFGKDTMQGKFITTYDAQAKQWIGWWFDNMMPMTMKFTGNFEGKSLVLMSEPTTMPGVEGPVRMKTVWTKTGTRTVSFRLTSEMGGKWVPMINGEYVRSR